MIWKLDLLFEIVEFWENILHQYVSLEELFRASSDAMALQYGELMQRAPRVDPTYSVGIGQE